jgi:hypothetical protein
VLAAILTPTDSVLQYPKAHLILILIGNRPSRSKVRLYALCADNRIREFITLVSLDFSKPMNILPYEASSK